MCQPPELLTGYRIWADESRHVRVDFWVYKDGKQVRRVRSGPFSNWPAAQRRAQRFKDQAQQVATLMVHESRR